MCLGAHLSVCVWGGGGREGEHAWEVFVYTLYTHIHVYIHIHSIHSLYTSYMCIPLNAAVNPLYIAYTSHIQCISIYTRIHGCIRCICM